MRAAALALLACLLLGACGASREPVLERRLFAMGTWVDLTIATGSRAAAEDAAGEAATLLRIFERDYYAWADGELARLNRAIRAGRAVEVEPGLARLLRRAAELSRRSGGAFDPGIGALVELWGFDGPPEPGASPPDRAAVEARLKPRAGIASVTVEGDRVRGADPTVALDLGGIAKGEAVDRIVEIFRRHGIRAGLVNAGGDLRAVGGRGDRAWRVGIRSPRGAGLIGVIELGDGEAAFTSGDYERFFEHGGERLHHVLDPATGRPAAHTQAVTVIAADGVTADAAATAIFVAGPDRWRGVARSMGVTHVLRVDASGRIETTGEMRDRIQKAAGDDSDIIGAGTDAHAPPNGFAADEHR